MRKSEITTRGSVWSAGGALPALNVKVYKSLRDISAAEWAELQSEHGDGFTLEWIEAHVDEDSVYGAWTVAACEDGFEMAQSDAADIFSDYSVRCELDGRQGGWLVVRGLPAIEEWDAVMVAKWSRFARYCAAIVADIPRATAWLIGANVYSAELEAFQRAELQRDNINADALASLAVG